MTGAIILDTGPWVALHCRDEAVLYPDVFVTCDKDDTLHAASLHVSVPMAEVFAGL